ncbi:uncharacterized protein A1O9_09924 [Exophiala aquamarina CBS 119918]|uniref:Major facilitator superfamily (MFS) profile domain-containing protein n=1 Tax=Exophiala aquamarina CBS 119918 TaxID=1182545 RepID=A0A072P1X1_9EURO|nr:uncharacterized protein A1O9_09924 [Exophiala aquamarina CBS 119918]KEF54129.1 hypothetical protein A1O9_09924 [Exophiala aquamarina CBS 119918]
MEEIKETERDHREFGPALVSSPSTSSHNPDDKTSDLEKNPKVEIEYSDPELRGDDTVTLKTWVVVVVLAMSYGISFWPVSFFSIIQSQMAVELGERAAEGAWVTAAYSLSGTIAFMVCGANSDLFGRRAFILGGNVLVLIGSILGGTAHSLRQIIAAQAFLGFGGGNCQIAAFALPELLPNKWRHIGVVIADAGIYVDLIMGPVVSRIAFANNAWRWGYWGVTISQGISFVLLLSLYFPPKHPRGIPWDRALRDLDYVGMVSFIAAASMIVCGIVYVQLRPANSPIVVGLLVAGFTSLIIFALWETFNKKLKEPLTPTRLFTANKGRTLTAPFICSFIACMFYYATNYTWPTMISVYFTNTSTPRSTINWLSTVQGFGTMAGGALLALLGKYIGHWRWQMGIPITLMTFFGAMAAYVTPERQDLGICFAFLCSTFYGYSQYLSITWVQFGAEQTELGIAGGLAGVARYAGGAVAVTTFSTIMLTAQTSYANTHVVAAAEAAGASADTANAVLAALPMGAAALEKIPGLTPAIAEAAGSAFVQSWVEGVKKVAFSSIGFGSVAIIACFFLEDIGPKMNNRIEVFLENDTQAQKNVYH